MSQSAADIKKAKEWINKYNNPSWYEGILGSSTDTALYQINNQPAYVTKYVSSFNPPPVQPPKPINPFNPSNPCGVTNYSYKPFKPLTSLPDYSPKF